MTPASDRRAVPTLDAEAGGRSCEAGDARKSAAERAERGSGRRLHGALAHYLGARIVAGDYKPGEALPSELDGSETLKVSRGAYREAIRTLAAKGLVDSRPRAGTTVLPRRKWNLLDPEVLVWTFSGAPDLAVFRSLFELRVMIEPGAAAIAAERRTRADIRAMREALAAMARYGLCNAAGQAADFAFHEAILRATGNDYLVVLTSSIGTAITMTTQFKQRSRALPRDPITSHRRVLNAIVAGDAEEAAAAMRTLVDNALEDTRQAME